MYCVLHKKDVSRGVLSVLTHVQFFAPKCANLVVSEPKVVIVLIAFPRYFKSEKGSDKGCKFHFVGVRVRE